MEEEMKIVQKLLANARDFNMLEEVVYTALKEMQQNPSLSIPEALQRGCNEWDV